MCYLINRNILLELEKLKLERLYLVIYHGRGNTSSTFQGYYFILIRLFKYLEIIVQSYHNSFENSNAMANHSDSQKKSTSNKKSFQQTEDLKSQTGIQRGGKPYECNQCGVCFRKRGNLTSHMRIHTGKKKHQCTVCEKSFSESGSLTKHMRSHTGEKPYECSQCGKCFSQSSHLTSHMRIHTGEKEHQCSRCGKCFSDSSSLSNHMSAVNVGSVLVEKTA